MKFLGSSAEVELVGDRDEVTQVPKFQLSPRPLFLKLSEYPSGVARDVIAGRAPIYLRLSSDR